jgi:hypothetical protein
MAMAPCQTRQKLHSIVGYILGYKTASSEFYRRFVVVHHVLLRLTTVQYIIKSYNKLRRTILTNHLKKIETNSERRSRHVLCTVRVKHRAPAWIRKWPTHDTRKFPNVTTKTINRIRILPSKFAFKDHFIVKILTPGEVSDTGRARPMYMPIGL